MDELMPWLAAIGWGLLHGLSPASGWVLAADRGLQACTGLPAAAGLWLVATFA